MKRILLICLLIFGLILSWTLVYAGDFYVIPIKKKNYAPVEKTGQKDCYYDDGATTETCTCGTENCPSGQDGDLEKGVTWPNPRFTDNGNGTVTDNLTGLIWLKTANCDGQKTWANALTWCNSLEDGCSDCGGTNNDCGLSDGSSAGDWRLPNIKELQSLIDFSQYDPALPSGYPFGDVQSAFYWSSSTYEAITSNAWDMNLYNGHVGNGNKINTYYVWPVRGGQ